MTGLPLLISLCALVCGTEGFGDFEEFGQAQRDWLGRLLARPNGIPSHDTFGRVFALLDPAQLAETCTAWTQSLRAARPGELIALDGRGGGGE